MRFLLLTALGFVATVVNAGWYETSIPRREVLRKQLRARAGDLPSLLNGTIEVIQSSDGTSLGYITDASSQGLVTAGAEDGAYKVSFTPTGSNQMQILVKSPAAGLPNLGLTSILSAVFTKDDSSRGFGILARQEATNPGARPAYVEDSYDDANASNPSSAQSTGSESAIWSYNAITSELTATWINPDRSPIPVQFFFENNGEDTSDAPASLIGGAGDAAEYTSGNDNIVSVQFYFRPSV